MRILYFAWLRERLNKAEDTVDPPEKVATVADLLGWLSEQDEASAFAFSDHSLIRAAVDEEIVDHNASIRHARTVALFPPMTGG